MHDESSARQRLRGLVVAHLFLGIAQLGTAWLPIAGGWFMPAMWDAVSLAQLTLLSFWVGMGGNSIILRALGLLVGSTYITIWPITANVVSLQIVHHDLRFLVGEFLVKFSASAAFVSLLSGGFVLWRRKCTKLVRLSESSANAADLRVRYSILHLLIIISTCSLLLSLMRIARPSNVTNTENDIMSLPALATLVFFGHVINSICAAWASLSLNSPWPRIALAIVVALLLGAVQSFSSGHDAISWWMVLSTCLIPVLSTAIVIVSLLVVRSCGYRLMPKDLPQADP